MRLWLLDTLVWDETIPMPPSLFHLGASFPHSARLGIRLSI